MVRWFRHNGHKTPGRRYWARCGRRSGACTVCRNLSEGIWPNETRQRRKERESARDPAIQTKLTPPGQEPGETASESSRRSRRSRSQGLSLGAEHQQLIGQAAVPDAGPRGHSVHPAAARKAGYSAFDWPSRALRMSHVDRVTLCGRFSYEMTPGVSCWN